MHHMSLILRFLKSVQNNSNSNNNAAEATKICTKSYFRSHKEYVQNIENSSLQKPWCLQEEIDSYEITPDYGLQRE